jgi:hypothetical protein
MARMPMYFAAAAALTLAACATQPSYEDPPVTYDFGAQLTPVLAWRDDGPAVRIRVPSNGCTTKDSFYPEVTGAASAGWAFDLGLIRVHPDECRAMMPTGVELSWTKDELGLPDGARLRVINPRNHDFY